MTNYTTKKILVEIFRNGELVYDRPGISEIRNYCTKQLDTLWDAVKRFENPHNYYVDLSPKLWQIRDDILRGFRNKK